MPGRIAENDNALDALVKLWDGQSAALDVMLALLERSALIDPDNASEGFGAVLALDSLGIYGRDIWKLYSEVCSEDLILMVALMRAAQLHIISAASLKNELRNPGHTGLNLRQTLLRVQTQLPAFGRRS